MVRTVVMLVDDEVQFVETMTKRLSKRNFEIVPAYSGYEALDKLREIENIDVVVLDIKMPGIDGLETLREIKRTNALVEVIILTGHSAIDAGIEGMKLGAFDYFTKPCNIEQLIEKINEAKQKKTTQEEKIARARASA